MAPSRRHLVNDLLRELARLERQRDTLDRAIARLRQATRWLRGLDLPAPAGIAALPVPLSLTNVCRAALRGSRRGLTPREVREFLAANGFDLRRFTNPLSAIHTVLKRLVSQNEAAAVVDEQGVRRYVRLRQTRLAGTPTQAEEAARIEHLLDGTVNWAGEIERRRQPAKGSRRQPVKGTRRQGTRRSRP